MLSFHLHVRQEWCIACGLCERLEPDLFAVADHAAALPVVSCVSGTKADRAMEIAEACPTEAIEMKPMSGACRADHVYQPEKSGGSGS